MASKGPRSKLDHETRARRQKALEAPKEPPRPKTHWDHVLEEMVWLSKDFESERKWKLAQAKRVAIRASKSVLDYATRGEKKVKEEEQRLKKVAINISKDVKKFWIKIEKLVLYKFQLELEERKKKTLDKQLDFLLGQTERYSTMLAENLVDVQYPVKTLDVNSNMERHGNMEENKVIEATTTQLDNFESDDDFSIKSEDELDDDEHTIEVDEAQITEDERREELVALKAEAELPLEELLKSYTGNNLSQKDSAGGDETLSMPVVQKDQIKEYWNQANGSKNALEKFSDIAHCADNTEHHSPENNHAQYSFIQLHHREINGDSTFEGQLTMSNSHSRSSSEIVQFSDAEDSNLHPSDDMDDGDYALIGEEEKDDETTLSQEEELAKKEINNHIEEIKLLQEESEVPIDELLARYKQDPNIDDNAQKSKCSSSGTDAQLDSVSVEDAQHETQNFKMDNDPCQQDNSEDLKESESVLKEITVDDNDIMDGKESEIIIADAAAAARSAQPTGNTFSTTKVRTKFPFLLKHPLREYQHIGLDWLVTMYEKRLNGILADEMGLGKTIMTIALLAHLACEKGIWGPHLIVVPTSVMLNWETEFLKWCPAFKILTYFGSAKERKHKRQGWLKPHYFHVCITTYRLVIQDSKVFKRKKWKYLILDEAHLIKNWKSQRWQTLLNFNSKRRILLTGTPLQNDLMELWSLMHFLMPHIFQSHQEFKDWFCNPISGMVEGQEKVNKEVIDRLHNVLRPFILRRLKRDVEKQLPKKHEHVIYCRLSRRQRNLYEDFIASSETQATLASSNFFGMISVIMQLRKVCNHPDLFEGRPIVSSFDMAGIDMQLSSSICTLFTSSPFSQVDLCGLNFIFTHNDFSMTSWENDQVIEIACPQNLIQGVWLEASGSPFVHSRHDPKRKNHGINIFEDIQKALWEERMRSVHERAAAVAWWNSLQCHKKPVYGTNLRKLVTVKHAVFDIHEQKCDPSCFLNFASRLADIVLSPVERFQKIHDLVECFMFAIPAARAPFPTCWCSKGRSPAFHEPTYKDRCTKTYAPFLAPIRPAIVRRQVYFPDRRLIQFDCGKLQELAILLRRLKAEGHRALIFTQMTKMLDILEAFINLYGYTYMRLDGSTQPEERQTLMQRFNTNPKFFLFILSTRSGGVGINLVGADTVIFYDSDWNPAMDQQAQDRCHRIGQTREVHIYRLISECTIEENILKKANQKRALDDLVIQSGSYNMEFFKKLDPIELFSGHGSLSIENLQKGSSSSAECSANRVEALLSNADVEAAIKHAEDEADYMALKKLEEEEAVDNQEFTEDVTGRSEDDEPANEDDMKIDDKVAEDQNCQTSVPRNENNVNLCGSNMSEKKALTLAVEDDEIDMLADVKQMAAAAAAAGQASSSFENQLRPIDRYAMRFLELWDPIVDKSAIEYQANVEEQEWELDRIERFKDDLEAEIDEDQEPFLYERWDSDFATTAYRQRVEALAQQQLLEELESEAQFVEDADDENDAIKNGMFADRKPKSRKKIKKTKFKSLKKGSLASDLEVVDEESQLDAMSIDDIAFSPDINFAESPPCSPLRKKRKKVVQSESEENNSRKSNKKFKKVYHSNHSIDYDNPVKHTIEFLDLNLGGAIEPGSANRNKIVGRNSVSSVPAKRVLVVKPERLKKRGHVWSKDCFPDPDGWSSQEDALLCAMLHEYGTNWSLASETLYSIPGGGSYRGRFRHPVHCCERFRELFFKYVLSAMENPNAEKISSSGSGKALLKVTEDQIRVLLNVTSELPDNELLLQKHFIAILSSVWRANCRHERSLSVTSKTSFFSNRNVSDSPFKKSPRLTENMNLTSLRDSSKLVLAALIDAYNNHEDPPTISNLLDGHYGENHMDLTLNFPGDKVDECALPSAVCVSIYSHELLPTADEPPGRFWLAEPTCRIAENRFRLASEACFQGDGYGWASSAFPSFDTNKNRACAKSSQLLSKHKSGDVVKPPKSKVQKTTEVQEDSSLLNKCIWPSDKVESSNSLDNACDYSLGYDIGTLVDKAEETEFVSHAYDPSFYSGLVDFDSLLDITDIG